MEFKYKLIFRELGKVFGRPKGELEMLAGKPMDQHYTNEITKMIHHYGMMIEKYPNQRSMHSCGILHLVFEQQFGETYRIMLYEEDIIKIALHYGGVVAADGDILRRAMSGKGRSKAALQKVKDNFLPPALPKDTPSS